MSKKMVWGLGILIILLITAGGFIYWQWSDVQKYKEQLAQDAKHLEGKDKQVSKDNPPPIEPGTKDNPPPAEPGFKWIWHHNYWDKVPIVEQESEQHLPGSIDLHELDPSKFDFIPADDVKEFRGARNFVHEMKMWSEENNQRLAKTKELWKEEEIARKVLHDFLDQGPEDFTEEGLEAFKVKADELSANVRKISEEKKKYIDITPMPRPDN